MSVDPTEHEIQAEFFREIRRRREADPRLHLIFAVPNGARLSNGARGWNGLKSAGAEKGVSDVIGLIPIENYHGFVIEFKQPGKDPTEEQITFLKRATEAGYPGSVCYSANQALVFLDTYLKGLWQRLE